MAQNPRYMKLMISNLPHAEQPLDPLDFLSVCKTFEDNATSPGTEVSPPVVHKHQEVGLDPLHAQPAPCEGDDGTEGREAVVDTARSESKYKGGQVIPSGSPLLTMRDPHTLVH